MASIHTDAREGENPLVADYERLRLFSKVSSTHGVHVIVFRNRTIRQWNAAIHAFWYADSRLNDPNLTVILGAQIPESRTRRSVRPNNNFTSLCYTMY